MEGLCVIQRPIIAQSLCSVLGPCSLSLATLNQSFANCLSRKSLLGTEPCVFVTTRKRHFLVSTRNAFCLHAAQPLIRKICYLPESRTLLTSTGPHLDGCRIVDPRDTITVEDHPVGFKRFQWSFQSEVTAMTYGGATAFVGCELGFVSAWDTQSGSREWELRSQYSGKVDRLHLMANERILLVGTEREDGWSLSTCLQAWSIDKVLASQNMGFSLSSPHAHENWRRGFAHIKEMMHDKRFIYIAAFVGQTVHDQGVVVCDTQTGQTVWQTTTRAVSMMIAMGPLICFDMEDLEDPRDELSERRHSLSAWGAHTGNQIWMETLEHGYVCHSLVFVSMKGFVVASETSIKQGGRLVARAYETGVEIMRLDMPFFAWCLQYCATADAILGAIHMDDDNDGARTVGAWDIHNFNMLFQVELGDCDVIHNIAYLPSTTHGNYCGPSHTELPELTSEHGTETQTVVNCSFIERRADADADKLGEQSDVSEAIFRSKLDCPALPLSPDGIMIFRIKRCAHAEDTLNILLESPVLEECRFRVIAAGCDIMPDWGNGAKFLVPVTRDQFHEGLTDLGIELQSHHIIALKTDMERIEAAFRCMPSRRRARINLDHGASYPEACANSICGEMVEHSDSDECPAVVIEPEVWPKTDSSLGFPQ